MALPWWVASEDSDRESDVEDEHTASPPPLHVDLDLISKAQSAPLLYNIFALWHVPVSFPTSPSSPLIRPQYYIRVHRPHVRANLAIYLARPDRAANVLGSGTLPCRATVNASPHQR